MDIPYYLPATAAVVERVVRGIVLVVGGITITNSVYTTVVPIIPLSVRGNTVTIWGPLFKPSNPTGDLSLLSLLMTLKLPIVCTITEYPKTTEVSKLHKTIMSVTVTCTAQFSITATGGYGNGAGRSVWI